MHCKVTNWGKTGAVDPDRHQNLIDTLTGPCLTPVVKVEKFGDPRKARSFGTPSMSGGAPVTHNHSVSTTYSSQVGKTVKNEILLPSPPPSFPSLYFLLHSLAFAYFSLLSSPFPQPPLPWSGRLKSSMWDLGVIYVISPGVRGRAPALNAFWGIVNLR